MIKFREVSRRVSSTKRFGVLPIFLIFILAAFTSEAQLKLKKSQIDSIQFLVKKEMVKQHIPAVSIAIAIDTAIVWEKAFGLADNEHSVKATTATKFRSASIGKTMTATAVMQLVERGKIKLSDTINQF